MPISALPPLADPTAGAPGPPGPKRLSGAALPPAPDGAAPIVLDVRDLRTYFYTYDGVVRALDGVTFRLKRGETVGLVGETGCGKSVTAMSVLRLIPDPPGLVVDGHAYFRGGDILWGLAEEASITTQPKTGRVRIRRSFAKVRAARQRMAAVRGRGIAMIFQEPSQAMNPIFSVANQLSESILLHRGIPVIDGLLAATPRDPEVGRALEALADAAAARRRESLRPLAEQVGRAARLDSFGTQAYYIAREAMDHSERALPELEKAARRLNFSRAQLGYLRHSRRLLVLEGRANDERLGEMRDRTPHARALALLGLRQRGERASHFYFGLWGLRRRVHRPLEEETFWRSVRLLEGVQIANPVQVARSYPYELSGGMIQRVMIAMALASDPDVLFADEPTTALDVTIQAQILALMRDLKERVGTAILLITHDLAVIAEVADRVCVMYAGLIIESAPVKELFRRPLHPYTQGLLASIPRLDRPDKALESIPGSVPNLITPPSGCRFHPRCPHAMPVCKGERPPLTIEGTEHTVACYLYTGPVVQG